MSSKKTFFFSTRKACNPLRLWYNTRMKDNNATPLLTIREGYLCDKRAYYITYEGECNECIMTHDQNRNPVTSYWQAVREVMDNLDYWHNRVQAITARIPESYLTAFGTASE